jgi:SAM-dependent methyltransferase
MNDGKIPFPDNSFDCVVNNQVLEHVKDLDSVLAEMHRVLKPNGRLLTLCPSSEVIYEGHCGVPLVHKLSKYKRLGYCWLLTFRALGFGYFKMGKPIRKWARDVQGWLNDKCFYRSRDEILDCLGKHGLPPIGIEREYLRFRSLPLTPWMLRQIFGLVLESKKGNTADTLVLRSASPVEITDAVASRVAAFLG